jgi:hypothetical protein
MQVSTPRHPSFLLAAVLVIFFLAVSSLCPLEACASQGISCIHLLMDGMLKFLTRCCGSVQQRERCRPRALELEASMLVGVSCKSAGGGSCREQSRHLRLLCLALH